MLKVYNLQVPQAMSAVVSFSFFSQFMFIYINLKKRHPCKFQCKVAFGSLQIVIVIVIVVVVVVIFTVHVKGPAFYLC